MENTTMRTKTIELFQYSELSDRAKERARDWYREASSYDCDNSYVIEDAATIAGFLGWDVNTRPVKLMNGTTRYEPAIYWSGFCSQGDGAHFVGTWRASNVDAAKLREHAPEDTELHKIAAHIESVAAAAPHASASVAHRGHYQHELCTAFEFDGFAPELDDEETPRSREEWDAIEEAACEREEELQEASRWLMQWIYKRLETEHEYQNSDETIAETIEANEYEFTADGERA